MTSNYNKLEIHTFGYKLYYNKVMVPGHICDVNPNKYNLYIMQQWVACHSFLMFCQLCQQGENRNKLL